MLYSAINYNFVCNIFSIIQKLWKKLLQSEDDIHESNKIEKGSAANIRDFQKLQIPVAANRERI